MTDQQMMTSWIPDSLEIIIVLKSLTADFSKILSCIRYMHTHDYVCTHTHTHTLACLHNNIAKASKSKMCSILIHALVEVKDSLSEIQLAFSIM